MKHVTRV